MLKEAIVNASRALRRLSGSGSEAEAREAELELRERHLPALEAEDPILAAAVRAHLRWVSRERALARGRLNASA